MDTEEFRKHLKDSLDRVVNFKKYETYGRQPETFGKKQKVLPVKSRLLEHKLKLRKRSLGNGIS